LNKYHFNIRINVKDNNAGSKATLDCRSILIENGFIDLEISFIKAWYLVPLNLVRLLFILIKYYAEIHPNSFIVVQYPLLGINRFFKYYIPLLKRKGCKVCCIIHDLDSLRSPDSATEIHKEIETLQPYDSAISHNPAMTGWLKSNGFTGHIEEIFLFDYLLPVHNRRVVTKRMGEIAFAGNLARGTFIEKLAVSNNSFCLNLYGPGFRNGITGNNKKIRWQGSYSPERISDELKGDFGLIWDGDSIEEITGLMGNYVRFNTPHKTSLYLSAGLPVIISKSAAIAPFVETNKIGICISSLLEIPERVLPIENDVYYELKENATRIGEELRRGKYLKRALLKVERFLFNFKEQDR
jgi:hypothetical protein